MNIREIKVLTDDVFTAFERLLPQLSAGAKPAFEDLEWVVNSDDAFLFVAEKDDVILGTLTLITYHIPTGKKAWIEDVVVDDQARGKGVGRKLTEYAIACAQSKGIRKIDLTSSPFREAANKLYQNIGFNKRDTNVYRMEFKG